MFVNDGIYYFLSDMTENEKRKEGDDYLMTCFVIHVCLLSLHICFRNSCFTKKKKITCRLPPTYKFEPGISWFTINHRNIDNHFSYEKVSCLKWVLRKRRYTENLLLKYAVRSNFIVCEDTDTATECSDYSDTESADEVY